MGTTLPLSTHFSRFRDFFVSTFNFKKMKYAATMLIFLILIIIASSHQDDNANHRQADEIGPLSRQLALARRRRDAMQMLQPLDGQKRQNLFFGNKREERREEKKKRPSWLHFWTKKAVTKTRIDTVYGMVWLPEVNRNVDLPKMEPMVWSSNEQSA